MDKVKKIARLYKLRHNRKRRKNSIGKHFVRDKMIYKKINVYLFVISLITGWISGVHGIIYLTNVAPDPYSEIVTEGTVILLLRMVSLAAGMGVLVTAGIKCFKWGYGLRSAILVISFFLLILLFIDTYLSHARDPRYEKLTGKYQLELFAEELFSWAEENNEVLPDANQWHDLLLERNQGLPTKYLRLPGIDDLVEYNVAMNKNLSGLHLSQIHPETVLLFIGNGDWNLNGGTELLWARVGGSKVILKNGQVKYVTKDEMNQLRWLH